MIDAPFIDTTRPALLATIRFVLPWPDMRVVVGPAISELKAAVAMQGIAASAPWFMHYLTTGSGVADFEVCVPVTRAVTETGRVRAGMWPATRVARTTFHGAYDGLAGGWSDFKLWLKSNGHQPGTGCWECYEVGPETSANPGRWRTELLLPVLDGAPAA